MQTAAASISMQTAPPYSPPAQSRIALLPAAPAAALTAASTTLWYLTTATSPTIMQPTMAAASIMMSTASQNLPNVRSSAIRQIPPVRVSIIAPTASRRLTAGLLSALLHPQTAAVSFTTPIVQ